MNLDVIKNALLTVTQKVSHYTAPQSVTGPYIVWAEDGQAGELWADGEMQQQVIQGTVDYFAKTENDPNVEAIQKALNEVCSWRLSSVQFEVDTGYIHYEFVWQVTA